MAHTFDLTHFGAERRGSGFGFLTLIGPAIRVARAVEQHARPSETDLKALGLKASDFDRVLEGERAFYGAE